MARIEGIADQAERDRELKRTELETDRKSKLSSEIEMEKLKHSFEMKHLELMGQLEVQRCRGHQMSFCKTEVIRESDDGIESIYQSKIDSSLNSDSKVKEGVCYFLKSRLPTAEGTVNSS